MSMLTKVNGLPAQAIEAYYRRMASRNGAGFQAKPEDVGRAMAVPGDLPKGFQRKGEQLSKAPRRSKRLIAFDIAAASASPVGPNP